MTLKHVVKFRSECSALAFVTRDSLDVGQLKQPRPPNCTAVATAFEIPNGHAGNSGSAEEKPWYLKTHVPDHHKR